MANPIVSDSVAAIQAINGVIPSAVALITGIGAKIDAAVAAALANGATAAELAPLTALKDTLVAETQQLADAVAANS